MAVDFLIFLQQSHSAEAYVNAIWNLRNDGVKTLAWGKWPIERQVADNVVPLRRDE